MYLALLIIFVSLVQLVGAAVCVYEPRLNVSSSSVTTLFPHAGDKIALQALLQSDELYAGVMEIYLRKGELKYPLASREIYIVPGDNKISQELELPRMLASGVYELNLRIGGFVYKLPLIINGSETEDKVFVSEDMGTLEVIALTDTPVIVVQEIVFADGRRANKEYSVTPVNNTAVIREMACDDCLQRIKISNNELWAVIEKIYGVYEEPYAKVIGLKKDKLELEVCAPGEYTVYINGENKGKMKNKGDIETELQSGYEKVSLILYGKGEILSKGIDLGEFRDENANISVKVIAQQPFTVRLSAMDRFGREVLSTGEIEIIDESGNTFYDKVSFAGSTERKYNLAEGRYIVKYNGVSTTGSAVPEPAVPLPQTQPKYELVPADLVPVIAAVLVLAVVVAIFALMKMKNWRRNV